MKVILLCLILGVLARRLRPPTVKEYITGRFCHKCKYYGPDCGVCQECIDLSRWEAKDGDTKD